jgi:hypothetical protein
MRATKSNVCAVAATAQPPWNPYQGTPTQPPWNLYQGTRFDPSVTDRGEHSWYGTQGPCFQGSPPVVDVDDNFNDDKDRPLCGQIVSPHQWDCCQLAQKAGHSPLDAAAVGRRGTYQLRLVERYLDVLVKHTTEIPPPTALVEVCP